MSRDSLLYTYLHRLVKTAAPQEYDLNRVDALFERLWSNLDTNTNRDYDLSQVISEIRTKASSSSWMQFQRTVDQLLKYKDSRSVARYLALLSSLLDDHVNTPDVSQDITSQKSFNRDMTERGSLLGGFAGSNYGDSYEQINFDRFSDRRSNYSHGTQHHENRSYTFRELLIPYFEKDLAEEDILKYISYTLAGTTSDLFPLQSKIIKLPNNVNNSVSGLLHLVLEIGLVYQDLSENISTERLRKSNSQIKIASLSFIQEELHQYLRRVNELFTDESFTLKTLYANLYDELVELRFLSSIFRRIKTLDGHAILSLIYVFVNHGDKVINQCANDFLSYCSGPFSNSIIKWIVEGELIENQEEFFITRDKKQSYTHLVDNLGIRFHKDRLPSYFSADIAFKIYNIGLTSYFLKFFCKETRWVSEFSGKTMRIMTRLKENNAEDVALFWDRSDVYRAISALYDEVLNYVNHILYTKFHLFGVILALKDYLLMGKGDFISSIIKNGVDLLNEPSNSLSGHQLTNLLRDSILKTTSRYSLKQRDNNYIINGLDARLLAVGHGNVGWDVFTLDYRIDSPLNLILNSEENQHKKDYLRVFNHLWKLKRLDELFEESWNENRLLKGELRDKKFKRIKLIQNFFYGFIKSIEGYLQTNVIAVKFGEFYECLKMKNSSSLIQVKNKVKVPKGILRPNAAYLKEINGDDSNFTRFEHNYVEYSIDELKDLHTNFLTSIIRHKLINGNDSSSKGRISRKHYVNQLNQLINTSFNFIITIRELHRVKLDQQMSHEAELLDRERIIYENLLKLFNEFNADLKVFVGDLANDDEIELRYLGVSLNQ